MALLVYVHPYPTTKKLHGPPAIGRLKKSTVGQCLQTFRFALTTVHLISNALQNVVLITVHSLSYLNMTAFILRLYVYYPLYQLEITPHLHSLSLAYPTRKKLLIQTNSHGARVTLTKTAGVASRDITFLVMYFENKQSFVT